MCLLIANPQNKPLDPSVLDTATESNPDGFGFACRKNGKVVIKKATDVSPISQLALLEEYGWPEIVHWRYTTRGKTCASNAHPFRISPTMALGHNGTLDLKPRKGLSDTATLARSLRRAPERAVRDLKKGDFGRNKFAILTTRKVHIVNEGLGTWNDGVWYSNDTGFESRWSKYLTNNYIPDQTACEGYETDLHDLRSRVTSLEEDCEWLQADPAVSAKARRAIEDLSASLQWWRSEHKNI